jgi:GrpB-like predicted nucleotidyltransferase (UPF0157 family)
LWLGLKRKTAELGPYNPLWVTAFEWLSTLIAAKLATIPGYRLEHFGSTSIPGIMAKPALDMMLIFESLEDLTHAIAPLESLGFIYKGDAVAKVRKVTHDPDRHFFSFYNLDDEDTDFIHLHALTKDHPDVSRNLRFRDTLRTDNALAQEYEMIKRNLSETGMPRHEYTLAKDEYIKRVFKNKTAE